MVGDGELVQRRDEPLTAELDGEFVMLDPNRGCYFSLNPIASRIWELLADPRSVNEVCHQLVTEFEVEAPVCQQQVRAFVDQLLEAELVETRS